MLCDKCGYVQVEFKPGIRDENGFRIPYEVRTGLKHNCDFTPPFPCSCGCLIYLDKKVLTRGTNKPRALDVGTDTYHYCKGPVKT